MQLFVRNITEYKNIGRLQASKRLRQQIKRNVAHRSNSKLDVFLFLISTGKVIRLDVFYSFKIRSRVVVFKRYGQFKVAQQEPVSII